jgi:hypothetical protein
MRSYNRWSGPGKAGALGGPNFTVRPHLKPFARILLGALCAWVIVAVSVWIYGIWLLGRLCNPRGGGITST